MDRHPRARSCKHSRPAAASGDGAVLTSTLLPRLILHLEQRDEVGVPAEEGVSQDDGRSALQGSLVYQAE